MTGDHIHLIVYALPNPVKPFVLAAVLVALLKWTDLDIKSFIFDRLLNVTSSSDHGQLQECHGGARSRCSHPHQTSLQKALQTWPQHAPGMWHNQMYKIDSMAMMAGAVCIEAYLLAHLFLHRPNEVELCNIFNVHTYVRQYIHLQRKITWTNWLYLEVPF